MHLYIRLRRVAAQLSPIVAPSAAASRHHYMPPLHWSDMSALKRRGDRMLLCLITNSQRNRQSHQLIIITKYMINHPLLQWRCVSVCRFVLYLHLRSVLFFSLCSRSHSLITESIHQLHLAHHLAFCWSVNSHSLQQSPSQCFVARLFQPLLVVLDSGVNVLLLCEFLPLSWFTSYTHPLVSLFNVFPKSHSCFINYNFNLWKQVKLP